MISLTPIEPGESTIGEDYGEVQYLLRRAGEEAVAAIRTTDSRVAASHAGMAESYSARSLELIAKLDDAGLKAA